MVVEVGWGAGQVVPPRPPTFLINDPPSHMWEGLLLLPESGQRGEPGKSRSTLTSHEAVDNQKGTGWQAQAIPVGLVTGRVTLSDYLEKTNHFYVSSH